MKNREKSIQIRNEAECSFIDIEGTIGIPEEWQFDHPDQRVATYEGFREVVQRIADLPSREIVVNIRSTGGDVNDALLIYEALVATGAHITTRCYGYTASAATLIAQAASEGCREIAPGALYLIHNSICQAEGNAEELEAQTELLRKTDARLAEIYALRSGRTAEEFALRMAENSGRGRWLSPEETLEAGLADRIVEHYTPQPSVEAPESLSQNIVRGWRRLMAALREEEPALPAEPPVEEHNFLHEPLPGERSATSVVALKAGQQRVTPTTLPRREDPSLRDRSLSANAAAYEADLKHFH